MDMTLINWGDAVKATKDGKVSGYLVRFGSPRDTDLEGDYFSPSTDFGRPAKTGDTFDLNLYYHHGLDAKVGRKAIGKGTVTVDEIGLWYEAQIDMSDEYRAAIASLATEKRLGFSSGAAGHLVVRQPSGVGKSYRIESWPLGEASLTPQPAEPRNMASVKSLGEMAMPMTMVPAEDPFEGWVANAASAVLSDLFWRMQDAIRESADGEGEYGSAASIIDRFAALAKEAVASMGVKCLGERPTTIKQLERRLREALSLSRKEAATIASKAWPVLSDSDDGQDDQPEPDGVKATSEATAEVAASTDTTRRDLIRRAMEQRAQAQA